MAINCGLFAENFFDFFTRVIRLSLANLIGADIASASVLISMGALLGRITPIQLLMMGLIEIVLFASNEFLQIELMKVNKFLAETQKHLKAFII